jgi:hypothetical protein
MTKQPSDHELTSALRYVRISPAELKFKDAVPTWIQPDDYQAEALDALINEVYQVSEIRAELQRINIKPQGRTRQALAEQLLHGFIDPGRVAACLSLLSSDALTGFLYLLLSRSLEKWYTVPESLDTLYPLSVSTRATDKKIMDAGLALRSESGQIYIPPSILSVLPPCNIPFSVLPEPSGFLPAQSPQDFLVKFQKILGLFDGRTYTLRDRLRWNAPENPYSGHASCWPPHPGDAKHLIAEIGKARKVLLLPPEPQLDDQALQLWAEGLDVPAELAEFYYHLLVQSAILHAGSPVRINQTFIQAWLALPPGRQIIILYHLYQSVSSWAEWWSLWREGHFDIMWDFQGYWGLVNIDGALLVTGLDLRCVLLDVLSFLPQEAWLSLESVIDWILKVYPTSGSHRYHRGLMIAGVEGAWKGWLKLVLKSILTGPLYTMGFADLAPSMEHVDAFRLHHLQDVHWGRTSELDSGVTGIVKSSTLHLDIKAQVMQVTMPIAPNFLSMIQLWSKPGELRGKTLHFHLDVERLHQTFENGRTPLDLRVAWEVSTGFTVPESLDQWWHHWWCSYGHIRLYPPQAVLMTRDDFTMKELQLAIPHLTDSIRSMVTSTAALLKPEDVDQILAHLERQGYMPKEVS